MSLAEHRTTAGLVSMLVLAAVAWISIAAVSPPAPLPADAAADVFSAERAYAHVERLGAVEHPSGSAGADAAREYIVSTLTGFGLQPEIQDAVGAGDALGNTYAMARVRNVVATIPGTGSTGPVVMFAHYDSVQVSFGGNDDGAGVATLLETARAVLAGPRPQNDLVFVFTEAEEDCLCGAEAFVSQHPLAADGGVALNFEARGSTGPVIMFETTRGNADLVRVYSDAVPYPVATSFAVEVYRLLPNDTDFSPFRDSGRFTGLNSAYIDGSAVYHTPQDKPATMDHASLQHHGANAVALARALGDTDVSVLAQPSAGDATYFPVLGQLIRYPGWLVWPLAIVAALLVLAVAGYARRRAELSWPRIAAGFGLTVVPLVLAPVVAQLTWTLLVAIRPGYRDMTDPWQPTWFRAAVVAFVAVVVLAWYALLRRRVGGWPLAIGALGWLAVLGIVLAAVAPGGSYLAAIPALAGSVGVLLALAADRPWPQALALTVTGAFSVLILAPTVQLFFPALGLATGAVGAFFAVLLGLVLLPVVDLVVIRSVSVGAPRSRRAPVLIAAGLTAVFFGTGLIVDRFDTEHPAPAELAYAMDASSGEAYWLSLSSDPGEWLAGFVDGPADLHSTFGLVRDGTLAGPAEPAALPAPTLTIDDDKTVDEVRTLRMTVSSERSALLVYLELPGATVLQATVAGRAVPAEQFADGFRVVFHAPPPDGVEFIVQLAGSGAGDPLPVRILDGTVGLTTLPGYHPRPAGLGVEGSHTSELVLVARTYTV